MKSFFLKSISTSTYILAIECKLAALFLFPVGETGTTGLFQIDPYSFKGGVSPDMDKGSTDFLKLYWKQM